MKNDSLRLVLVLALVLLASAAQARTMAERLGYGPSDKVLLIHVDDVGANSSVNRAARDVLSFGLAKSASALMPGPAAEEALSSAKALGTDFGVHVTLTSEAGKERWRPVAGTRVPSLVDSEGFLTSSLWKLYMFGKEKDVLAETEAQIQKTLAAGIVPTHMDTHVGTVFFKAKWFGTYLNLARKHRIVPMVPRWSEETKEQMGWLGSVMDYLVPGMLEKVEKAGFLQLDAVYILMFPKKDPGFEAHRAKYVDIIRNLKPGVSQIIIHPTYENETPGEMVRVHEAKIFQDPAMAQLIKEQGIHLIGWKEIAEVYPWHEIKDPEL